jgi:hypothetical protein
MLLCNLLHKEFDIQPHKNSGHQQRVKPVEETAMTGKYLPAVFYIGFAFQFALQ